MNIFTGIPRDNNKYIGGIKRVLMANHAYISDQAIDSNGVASFTYVEGAFKEYVMSKEAGSNFNQTITVDIGAGSKATEQVLTCIFRRQDRDKLAEASRVAACETVIIVEDNNRQLYVFGLFNGCDLITGVAGSGTAYSETNNLTLTLRAQEKELAPSLSLLDYATIISQLESGVELPVVPSPSSLTVSNDNGDAKLDWVYGGENLKIVFLGSSTTEGFGVPEEDSFVYKVNQHFAALYSNYEGINLGLGGTSTYHILPDGSTTAGRPAPDTTRNITHAVSLNPDIILVNMPSNDTAAGYTNEEFINNLITIKAYADNAGIPCFITTSQPRNFGTDSAKRHLLKDAAPLIMSEFGSFGINIYDELADSANDYRIKAIYNNGDGTHLKPLGHSYVADTVESVLTPFIASIMPSEADGFRIMRGLTAGSLAQIATVGDVRTYTDASIQDNITYHYAVRAYKGLIQSDNSNVVSFINVVDVSTAPAQVTGLTADATAYNNIDLAWSQPANGGSVITGYRIERRLSGGSFSTLVANTGSTSTAYSDGSVSASATYEYRVSAINAVGTGTASAIASDTTPAQPVLSNTMKINFGGTVGSAHPSPVLGGIDSSWFTIWHDVVRDGNASFILKDINGNDTTYTLHAEDTDTYKWGVIAGNNTGDAGAITGDESGIVPDNVSKFYWFTSTATDNDGAKLRISGLPVGSEWRLNFLASRDTADARRAGYTINGVTKDIAVGGNTSEFIVFDAVTADANGEINIIVKASSGWQYGYLNALTMMPEDEANPIETPLEAPANFSVTATGLGENTITFN